MKRKYIWATGTLLILAALLFAFYEYNRERKDSKTLDAKYRTSAAGLLKEFSDNQEAANKKYAGQNIIISVEGPVKDVVKEEGNHFILLLGEEQDASSVRCLMDTVYQSELITMRKGMRVKIKGNFNGFKPDELGIGADVELNYCTLDN